MSDTLYKHQITVEFELVTNTPTVDVDDVKRFALAEIDDNNYAVNVSIDFDPSAEDADFMESLGWGPV